MRITKRVIVCLIYFSRDLFNKNNEDVEDDFFFSHLLKNEAMMGITG